MGLSMKAKFLKLVMYASICVMIVATASLAEAIGVREINWTSYTATMVISLAAGIGSWWYYVAKGVEKA